MQVKVTVSKPGGKTGDSFSQSITLKDAATVEEVQERIAAEFGGLFPRYQTLDQTQEKPKKGKKDV
jgi:hypothetical protein